MYENEEEGQDESRTTGNRLQPGTYRARAFEAALGNTKDGKPQAAVAFRLLDEGFEGRTINWYGSFSKTLGNGTKTPLQRTIETLRTCGWTGDDLSNLSGVDANEVSLVLEREMYDGKEQIKIKWVNRAGGLQLKAPMTTDAARAFAAKMKGEVLAASKSIAPTNAKKSAAPHPNAPGGRVPGEDDLPY